MRARPRDPGVAVGLVAAAVVLSAGLALILLKRGKKGVTSNGIFSRGEVMATG